MKNEKFCFNKKNGVLSLLIIFIVTAILLTTNLLQVKTSTNSRADWNVDTCWPWDYGCLCGQKTYGLVCKQYKSIRVAEGQFDCKAKKLLTKCEIGCNIDKISCNTIWTIAKNDISPNKLCTSEEINTGRFKCFQIKGENNYYQFACGSVDARYFKCVDKCGSNGACEIIPTPLFSQMLATSSPTLTPTPYKAPTLAGGSKDLTLKIVDKTENGLYISNTVVYFYKENNIKYHASFYGFAGESTDTCNERDKGKEYKRFTMGQSLILAEGSIPDLYLYSQKTNNGTSFYLMYKGVKYDLFTFVKDKNAILVGVSNSDIPGMSNTYKIVCFDN